MLLRCTAPLAVLLPLNQFAIRSPSLALSSTECSRSRHALARLLSISKRGVSRWSGPRRRKENVGEISQLRISDSKSDFTVFRGIRARPVGQLRIDRRRGEGSVRRSNTWCKVADYQSGQRLPSRNGHGYRRRFSVHECPVQWLPSHGRGYRF